MKIVGQRYCSAPEFLQDAIYQSYNSVAQFLAAFNADDYMPDVRLSKSLVDSWLIGRRKIGSSSASLVWKVCSVLCHHQSEKALYVMMNGLLHGAFLPVYADGE